MEKFLAQLWTLWGKDRHRCFTNVTKAQRKFGIIFDSYWLWFAGFYFCWLQSHYRQVPRWSVSIGVRHNWKCFLAYKNIFLNFILCSFLVWTLQCFYKFFLTTKTWKKRSQKLLISSPNVFFSSNANWPKSSPNLNSCSIKISHRGSSL